MESYPVGGGEFNGTRLTVIRTFILKDARGRKNRVAECLCECGQKKVANVREMERGNVRSCGCLRRDRAKVLMRTHGNARRGRQSSEYKSWTSMKHRCSDPNHVHYSNYGGRGITVCDRWMNSFQAFLEDMGPKPSPKHSIEREDGDGNYEPGNCHWATDKEQCRNRRNNRLLTFNGETKIITDWAEQKGIGYTTLWQRLRSGWSVERALTTPARKKRR